MKKEKLIQKIERFEKQKADELANGWTIAAENTQKTINALKTHLK